MHARRVDEKIQRAVSERRRSLCFFFFFSSRRRHTRLQGDWSSDVCSSDLHCHYSDVHRADPECGQYQPDRKSTRLNSSHLVISYAVFCLKKKKNKHQVLSTNDTTPSKTVTIHYTTTV